MPTVKTAWIACGPAVRLDRWGPVPLVETAGVGGIGSMPGEW